MNETSTTGDAMTSRIIDEIVFEASLLALHNAIEAATQQQNQELHSLVERVRRPVPRGC